MKIYRSNIPEPTDDGPVGLKEKTRRGRRPEGDLTATARCPRCGFEIVARMGSKRPILWCRCPARAPLPKRAA